MADSNKSRGLTFCSVLFIVFLVLKLTGNIDWSWWWVTAPLWVPAALNVSILVVALACELGVVLLRRR